MNYEIIRTIDLDWTKGQTLVEMVGWHHRHDGHEFEQALRAGDGQKSLACDHGVTKSWTRLSDWTELKGQAWGFPGGSVVKNLPISVADEALVPGLGRSPGEGNGNPFRCSCLGNPVDRGAWWAIVQVVAKNWAQLSDWAHTHTRVRPSLSDELIFRMWLKNV